MNFSLEATDGGVLVVVSVISHGHGAMLPQLVHALLTYPEVVRIVVTLNVPEVVCLPDDVRLLFIRNTMPRGFSANHNAAFLASADEGCMRYFCPINPDVALANNPFPGLLRAMNKYQARLVAPLVLSVHGNVEDSIRRFPTASSLVVKLMGGNDGRYPVRINDAPFSPEWVAGMFMLFERETFERLGGYDEKFFLYYEDVDICARAWKVGLRILACPHVSVVHDARRESRRNLRYMCWHVVSMARYFFKHWGRLPSAGKL